MRHSLADGRLADLARLRRQLVAALDAEARLPKDRRSLGQRWRRENRAARRRLRERRRALERACVAAVLSLELP